MLYDRSATIWCGSYFHDFKIDNVLKKKNRSHLLYKTENTRTAYRTKERVAGVIYYYIISYYIILL